MARAPADERFKKDITPEQIKANLKVLAEFRTDVAFSSNLTIRAGLFKKTTGKLNLFKGIVRDEQDSLSNQDVLTAIYTNLERFESTFDDTDDNFDILCNAMYGFLLLGSKYRDRDTVANIANAMSLVCEMAYRFFEKRLEDKHIDVKQAKYNQSTYNENNKVHLDGTCWAMVMDWARRIVLKEKMGYAHGLKPLSFGQEKLLHRGMYIANVMDLNQKQNYASVGAALNGLKPKDIKTVERTDELLQEYDKQRSSNSAKRTVVEKFNDLSFSYQHGGEGGFGLCNIHIGNLDDVGKKNTRLLCIATLLNKISLWKAEAAGKQINFFAYGIGFNFKEKIGYQLWSVNRERQDRILGVGERKIGFGVTVPKTNTKTFVNGHAIGVGYSLKDNKFCIMDPNFGEWASSDPNKIANIIYDIFKNYTVGIEKGFDDKGFQNKWYCAEIYKTRTNLFSKKI